VSEEITNWEGRSKRNYELEKEQETKAFNVEIMNTRAPFPYIFPSRITIKMHSDVDV
jgi:hypothetical protein